MEVEKELSRTALRETANLDSPLVPPDDTYRNWQRMMISKVGRGQRNSGTLPKGVYRDANGTCRAYAVHEGRRVDQRGFSTPEAAAAWRELALDLLRRGLEVPKNLGSREDRPLHVGELIAAWWRSYHDQHPNLSYEVVCDYERWQRELADWFDGWTVGRAGIHQHTIAFMTHLANDRQQTRQTAMRRHRVIVNSFEFARANGWMLTNPAFGVVAIDPPANTRALGERPRVSPTTTLQVIQNLSDEHRLPYVIQLYTGCRPAEAFGLKLEDRRPGVMIVRRQRGARFKGKDGKFYTVKEWVKGHRPYRLVAVPEELERYIARYLEARGRTDPGAYICDLPKDDLYDDFAAAVSREFERAGVRTSTGAVPGPRNLRFEYSQILHHDLMIKGGRRSRLLGHQRGDGKEERVTNQSYTYHQLSERDIKATRKKLSRHIARWFGGDLGSPVHPGPGDEWVPLVEAAQLLGYRSEGSVRRQIEQGNLRRLGHHWPGENVTRAYVHHDDVNRILHDRDQRLPKSQAAAELGLQPSQLDRALREAGVASGPSGAVSVEGFAKVRAHVEEGEAFRARVFTRAEASALLGLTAREFSGLVALDRITAVPSVGFQPSRSEWFDRAQVVSIAPGGKRSKPDPTEYLTLAAACARLTISPASLHRWVRSRKLEAVSIGRDSYITARSIRNVEQGH
jgi:integrase